MIPSVSSSGFQSWCFVCMFILTVNSLCAWLGEGSDSLRPETFSGLLQKEFLFVLISI